MSSRQWLRSEPMIPVRLWIQRDAAHSTFKQLGEKSCLQLRDLNSSLSLLQRHYVTEVKLCEEIQRSIAFFTSHLQEQQIPIDELAVPNNSWSLEGLESELKELESKLRQLIDHDEVLKKQLKSQQDFKLVLESIGTLLDEASTISTPSDYDIPSLLEAEETSCIEQQTTVSQRFSAVSQATFREITAASQSQTHSARLGFLSGIIPSDRSLDFSKHLWRSTRGNFYIRFADVRTSSLSSFLIFYSGSVARQKILKVMDAFGAKNFVIPENSNERVALLRSTVDEISEKDKVLTHSNDLKQRLLQSVANKISAWSRFVLREKSVFHALNHCNLDASRGLLVAEGWVLKQSLPDVRHSLQLGAYDSGLTVSSFMEELEIRDQNDTPPTHFQVGKIRQVFQDITDSYGVPRYGEVNPSFFSLVFFPFLFALMFGDVGHGLMLTCVALAVIMNERKLQGQKLGDIMGYLYAGRYILLLMGLLSIYVGFIFNDIFSLGMPLFRSAYSCPDEVGTCTKVFRTYPFGIDSAWKFKATELPFLNSFKMKFSIIVGIFQMTVGLVLSLLNHRHFKSSVNIFGRFIPETIMLLSIFGYLVVTIYIKWFTFFENTYHSPSLIHLLINMFLSPNELTPDEYSLFKGQLFVQQLLLVLFIVSIIWLLTVKPVMIYKTIRSSYRSLDDAGPRVDFPDVCVHQVIHTIEYVLGCISNTASYLRLWALSLSHAALSEVFYDMILASAIKSGNVVVITFAFAVFTFTTIGVMVVMEALSAFLHTLRLTWVEFQSKFYYADGVAFKPFKFD
ncbi:hypothetical protein RCL1_006882 [Eukaryota sp. TZLM3-RCL]